MKTVGVVFGGPSSEHDISILTGLQCERVLDDRDDVAVVPIYWDRSGVWYSVEKKTEARDYIDGAPTSASEIEIRLGRQPGFYRRQRLGAKRVELDAILNCMHGGAGEGGGAQALFELMGVPATGGSVYAAALCMDKLAFAGICELAGVATLPRVAIGPNTDQPSYEGPYIVKPRFGGSSIGIEVVDDFAAARLLVTNGAAFRNGGVLEPFRPDLFDVNIAYRTFPQYETSAIERPLRASDSPNSIYSFAEKYLHREGLNAAPRELPAQISGELKDLIAASTSRLSSVLGMNGIIRLDYLTDGTILYSNEANSIPGAMSLYIWLGRDPAQLLLDAIAEAERKFARGSVSGDGSQGAALRAAGGIAGKLTGLPSVNG